MAHCLLNILIDIQILGTYSAPGLLTLCYDESISTPILLFPKLRIANKDGKLGMQALNYHCILGICGYIICLKSIKGRL